MPERAGAPGEELPTAWVTHDDLRAPRTTLERACDRMPPDVQQHVLTILREARYDNIMLAVGEGPYNVTERDLRHAVEAMDLTGALWRGRPG